MADNWQLKAVISANSDGMIKALKGVNAAAKTTRKYLSDVGSSAANLAGHVGVPLALISGAMAGLSVAGLTQAVMGFARLGDEVHKSAQRIGVSTDEYQRIAYAAGQSGVSVEELGASMGRLNKSIAEAAGGKNKNLASLLKHAGISMRSANGELRAGTELLPEIAELFARNGNAATQARMGNAIFGKSWQALAPLLQGGKAGIDELNERYKMLGTSMDENALVAGEKFGDQLDDLKQVTASYGHTIGAKLLPVLSPLVEQMIKWAVANRALLTTKVSAFLADMTTSLSRVDWSGVIKGVGDFATGLKDLVQWVGGAKNALIGLVVVMNLQTVVAFGSLIAATWRLGWAFSVFAIKSVPKLLMALGFVPAPAVVAAVALDGVAVSTTAANTAALGFVGTLTKMLGIVTPLALALAPLAAMWGVTKWAEDTSHDKERVKGIQDNVAKPATSMLSWFGVDKEADYDRRRAQNREGLTSPYGAGPDPAFNNLAPKPAWAASQARPSLISPPAQGRVEGQVNINISGLPPGSRVEKVAGAGNMPINLNAGYRSDALGLSY